MVKLQEGRSTFGFAAASPSGTKPDSMFPVTKSVVRGLNVFEGLRGYWQPDG